MMKLIAFSKENVNFHSKEIYQKVVKYIQNKFIPAKENIFSSF